MYYALYKDVTTYVHVRVCCVRVWTWTLFSQCVKEE